MALLKFGSAVKAYGLGYAENEVGDLDDKMTLSVLKPDKKGDLVPTDVNAVEFLTDLGLATVLKPAEKKGYDDWTKKAKTNDTYIVGQ